jgi:hypothetical protein
MASVIRHRAWDTVGLQFVYWKAPFYDPTGLFWVGPPAFGALTEVMILTVLDTGIPPAGAIPFMTNMLLVSTRLAGEVEAVDSPVMPFGDMEILP